MRRQVGTALLISPMLVLLFLTLVLPVILMVVESVRDSEVNRVLPRTIEKLEGWTPAEPLPEDVYVALAADFAAKPETEFGRAAGRLNADMAGARSLLLAGQREFSAGQSRDDPRTTLVARDPRWGQRQIFQAIRDARGPLTDRFILAALDLKRGPNGTIVNSDQTIYRSVYLRTFVIAATVTVLCLILGLPVSVCLASLPPARAAPLLLLLMLPLWTSVLVRALAWILLLQNNGPVNQILLLAGIIETPLRLVFDRVGVVVAMTHVLLPFMILPMYNVMRVVPRNQLRAAGSLGASPWTVFRRIYLPQCRTGIAVGCLLVFASGSGYYITPALVGGGADQMVGSFVELAALKFSNLPLAAALGVVFMVFFILAVGALMACLRPSWAGNERPSK